MLGPVGLGGIEPGDAMRGAMTALGGTWGDVATTMTAMSRNTVERSRVTRPPAVRYPWERVAPKFVSCDQMWVHDGHCRCRMLPVLESR